MATMSSSAHQYIFILFALWFVSAVFLRFLFKKKTRATPCFHLPPSPPGLPAVGHVHYLRSVAFQAFHDLSTKYGPILHLRLAAYRVVLVSSAPIATEIFKTHDVNFAARLKSPFEDRLLFGSSVSFFNAPYGDYWKFMKKLSTTELLGASQMAKLLNVRREELLRFLNKILEKAQRDEVVDLSAEVFTLSNNSTCRMIMSARCSGEDNEAERCSQLVADSFDLATKLAFAELLGPFRKVFLAFQKQVDEIPKKYDDLFEKVLQEHEEIANTDGTAQKEKDLMDILLKVYHDKNAEVKITRLQMKTYFLDLFTGGTRTTTDGILWITAELIHHPESFDKLRDEIDSVVGKDRLVEESDVPNLPYLQAVVKEGLRLHPPVPIFDRVCRETCKIGGYDIPKGMVMVISTYSIMRDPKVWENPDDFKPERFLDTCKEHDKQREAKGLCDFVPFGAGRRQCPGSNLSMGVTHATVAAMVQCFDWKVVNGDGAKVNMQPRAGLSLTMAYPLQCYPAVRSTPFRFVK